ncbi:site-specific integrase [Lactococcus lactis]|uniref:tyrosine-type recombinase/integrase n=1 Tax=Lactococcus lactis TaxID=1358 RepID=UPI0030F48C09
MQCQLEHPNLKKEQTNKQKIKVFTDEELKVWLEYLDTLPDTPKNIYDVNLYMLLLETGMRIGEALALTWKDVDFNNQFIHVEATVTRAKRVQQMPKSQDSVRDIYINANTVKRLKDWKLHQAKTLKTISIGSNGYLFPGAHAPHGNYPQARDQFMRHLKKAGLPNIGLHGFRHTHATLLLNNGAEYKEIQHRLGHASISTTMDTYSHLSQEKARQTAEILNFSLKKIQ